MFNNRAAWLKTHLLKCILDIAEYGESDGSGRVKPIGGKEWMGEMEWAPLRGTLHPPLPSTKTSEPNEP